ncbi:unnamed protein product [Caenorhabditis brenneri]
MGAAQSNSRSSSRELPPGDNQVMDVLDPSESTPRRGRKRKSVKQAEVKKKKIAKLDTCAYVYNKLFIQGEESDITIAACGKEWKVHKLYLKQTKFFESMFDGDWAETHSDRVNLEISDPNIDVEGINAVLGSLYHNEIEIDLDNIQGTLAAASYVALDSVTERCAEMMIEALSIDNAIQFLDLSTEYGLICVKEKSLQLLLRNFWKISKDKEKLRLLEHDLLLALLNSPNLFITEGEYDIYKAVKTWIYMQECADFKIEEAQNEFKSNMLEFFQKADTDYLISKYLKLLCSVRFDKMLLTTGTLKAMRTDHLIPNCVINEISSDLWMSFLQNEENTTPVTISDDEFFERCFRLGRSLESIPKCWRWVGFNSGVDLLLHLNENSICIKRNCLNQKAPYSVNLKSRLTLHYRLAICDSNGRIVHDTGKSSWEMSPDETKTIFRMTEETQVPISIHFQYLIHNPIESPSYYFNKYLSQKQNAADTVVEEI